MSTLERKVEFLRACTLFEKLSTRTLKSIAPKFRIESFPRGTLLLEMDSLPDRVYLITNGIVKVSRPTNYGVETVINILGEGNLVGELSVIDRQKRSARVTCVQDVGVLSITGKDFNKIVEANASVASRLLRELARRIRTGNDNVVRKLEEQHYAIETRFLKLHRLIEASKIINSTLDLEKLLEVILDTAINALDADRGTLYLVDKAKEELWSKVWQGENVVEIRLPIGKGVAGHVAQTGKTINITDAYNDPHFNPEIDLKTGYRTNNILCMPLRNKDGKTIGVFQLLNKQQGAFDDDDEQFIEALSAHASVALENARMAREMVQNERLSAVGRMASTIIHDIKNPMSTLRVYAQVLKKKSGNEEAAKLADEMIVQVDRFVNMTQEILDFTRGVTSLNIAKVEFDEVMEGVLNFIEKDLSKNNVTLVRDTRFRGKIEVDKEKIVRVFYNIASNAKDAMPDGGTLKVSTQQENGFVRVDFSDTGVGIPDEIKNRIFEPFVSHGKKHGTGLGMAIVKKVIDDHKGRIQIESAEGKGTTISVYLPAHS